VVGGLSPVELASGRLFSDKITSQRFINNLKSCKIERPFYFAIIPTKRGNSMTAEYKVIGDVAIITMSNPPVNGLGLSTRVGITDGLSKANADSAVKSIIITGAGKAFSGGADIREFGTPKAIQEPNLLSVIRACENSDKPVLAAVHSVAMGGGL
jgi:enoyl-CoA hydratase/carnithine racemase